MNRRGQVVQLYTSFREDRPRKLIKYRADIPRQVAAIGHVEAIEYRTTHGRKLSLYRHDFQKGSRPLLCASGDGRTLLLLGGHFKFTDRGIVDRDDNGKLIFDPKHGQSINPKLPRYHEPLSKGLDLADDGSVLIERIRGGRWRLTRRNADNAPVGKTLIYGSEKAASVAAWRIKTQVEKRLSRNPVESLPGGGFIATGDSIGLVQLAAVKGALRLESLGMKRRGGSLRKPWALKLGLPGNTKYPELIAHIEKLLAEARNTNPASRAHAAHYQHIAGIAGMRARRNEIGKMIAHYYAGKPLPPGEVFEHLVSEWNYLNARLIKTRNPKSRGLYELLNAYNEATHPGKYRSAHGHGRNSALARAVKKRLDRAGFRYGIDYRDTDSGRLVSVRR